MLDPIHAKRRRGLKAVGKKMEELIAESKQYERDLSASGGKMTSMLELRRADILRRNRALAAELKSIDAEHRKSVREARAAYKKKAAEE